MRSAESLTYREWLSVLEEAIRQFNMKETYLIKNDLSERSITNHVDQGMGVNGVQYYNSYDIKTLSNGDVFLSPNIN